MTQNSIRLTWSPEEVDAKLKSIMQNIHAVCVRYGTQSDGYINYVVGANIGGFMKVANAMLAQGCGFHFFGTIYRKSTARTDTAKPPQNPASTCQPLWHPR